MTFLDKPVRQRWLAQLLLPLWWVCDRLLDKDPYCWAFFVHPVKPGQFVENSPALFEPIKGDPAIRKRVFSRGGVTELGLEGTVNTEVVELQSLRGLLVLWSVTSWPPSFNPSPTMWSG